MSCDQNSLKRERKKYIFISTMLSKNYHCDCSNELYDQIYYFTNRYHCTDGQKVGAEFIRYFWQKGPIG